MPKPLDCDPKRARSLVMDLLSLDGASGQERAVADYVIQRCLAMGFNRKDILFDNAHQRTPLKGNVGNLILHCPGTLSGPRRLLAAHMDTVQPAVGSKPIVRSGKVVDQRGSCLGADDRSGMACVLYGLETVIAQDLPHPPLTLLFTVQEEIGLYGARYCSKSLLKAPGMGFSFDGEDPSLLVIGAPSHTQFDVRVFGIPSHAGAHPEQGVSALMVASRAMAELDEKGWFGAVQKGKHRATANIGSVQGGQASNIVMPSLVLKGEARSHSEAFLDKVVQAYQTSFERAAKRSRNSSGKTATVSFSSQKVYSWFKLASTSPVVRASVKAVQRAGLAAKTHVGFGGLDANWLNAYGIPTVTLGSGAAFPHSDKEYLDLEEYYQSCEVATHLMTTG